MKKISIQEWKEFKIEELFSVNPTKNHKVTNKDLMHEDGINPVVVNSSYNNGIGGYTNYENTELGNVITFSDTTNADSIFYQENDFVGYSHVQVLKPIKYNEKWNKESLLFFTTVFKKKAKLMNFDYVNKFTRDDALKIIVKLPVDINGEPDWEYMERYVKQLYTRERESSDHVATYVEKSKLHKVDITKWKDFQINGLFQVKRPAPRSVKKYNDGTIPFVSSGNYNNGVDSYCTPLDNELLEKGNCITVSPVDGSTFYQPTDFLGRGGAGSSILLLYNDKLTKHTGLFLAAIIRGILTRKYQYNDMGSSESIKLEYIKLPVNIKNEIDWDYMENYMIKLEKTLKNMVKEPYKS